MLFSLYLNDIPTPSCCIDLAQRVDDTALIATSRFPAHLVKYLKSIWLIWKHNSETRGLRSMSWRMQPYSANRHTPSPRPLEFLGEETQWEEKLKYLKSIWMIWKHSSENRGLRSMSWRMQPYSTNRHTPSPRPLGFFGEETQWEEKVTLGITLVMRLTWPSYIDQVRR